MQEEIRFTAAHEAMLEVLSECSQISRPEANNYWNVNEVLARMSVPMDDHEAGMALQLMKRVGVITDSNDLDGYPFAFRIVAYRAEQVKDMIAAEKATEAKTIRPDIVEEKKNWARRNPWVAWPLIILGILTVVVTFLNQLFSLIKTFATWGNP